MNLAIFDLDNTLIAGDSDAEWPLFLTKRGLLPPEHSQQSEVYYQQYLAGTLDINEFLDFQLQPLARFSRQELDALHVIFRAWPVAGVAPCY